MENRILSELSRILGCYVMYKAYAEGR